VPALCGAPLFFQQANKLTNHEFSELDREQRLATLKFVADRDGVESEIYVRLAKQHRMLLLESSGVPLRLR
jgi:hypothetical protein